ncbi:MAG TPA: hypothetical protein VHL58_16315 [Thermoanaerobaculia bacterium]|nr:hypothetical protein [Thermoanaerobaculia bacterium]
MRTEYPDALYHVHSRGHQKKPVFLDDRDREHFLERLDKWRGSEVDHHCVRAEDQPGA